MLTNFQWFSLISILILTYAGGFYPLFRQQVSDQTGNISLGEAFTSGVFLALSLTLMFPSASHLLTKAFPDFDYPLASIIVILAFLLLLCIEHITNHINKAKAVTPNQLLTPSIPIIMTVMIAVPSFFLGTALGVSETSAAVFIWVAIVAHKSSAAFALALKMVRCTLSKNKTILIFSLFAFSTPLGIVFGQDVHELLSESTMVILKGTVLCLAAGTFLYMSTLHELDEAPLIKSCRNKKGFMIMLSGIVVTALVRLIIGEVHKMQ